MGMGNTLAKEGIAYAVLAITIVLFIIILGNINGKVDGILGSAANTTNSTIKSFISTTSTGLSEPKNWIAIIIIALIGFGIIKFISNKSDSMD